jgi:hypothetical protein
MDIQIGDRVQYEHGKKEYGNVIVEHGTVKKIDSDLMVIEEEGHGGKLTISAKRINGRWLAFCSYDKEYVKEVSKD